jgi:hypothetical protein
MLLDFLSIKLAAAAQLKNATLLPRNARIAGRNSVAVGEPLRLARRWLAVVTSRGGWSSC